MRFDRARFETALCRAPAAVVPHGFFGFATGISYRCDGGRAFAVETGRDLNLH